MSWVRAMFVLMLGSFLLSGCAAKMAYKQVLIGKPKVKCTVLARNTWAH